MQEKRNIFDKIKSIFVVDDGSTTKQNSGSKAKTTTPKSNQVQKIETVPDENMKPAEEALNILIRAIEKHDLDGFDYLEFKNSLKTLRDVIPDESMRFQTAFKVGATLGVTKGFLLHSGEEYLKVLKEENKGFDVALNNQKELRVAARQSDLSSIDASIEKMRKEIEKLNNQISEMSLKRDSLKMEIEDSLAKLVETEKGFKSSYQYVYNQIVDDLDKIKRYL